MRQILGSLARHLPHFVTSHSGRLRLAAALIGLMLSLVLAEVGLHVFGDSVAQPRLPLTYNVQAIEQIESGEAYVAFDSELGWVTTPGADRVGGDIHYRHNRAGLRSDRELAPAPRAGRRRLAAFGDSFTYCEEVDVDDCWTERLSEMWKDVEVLNYGVPGYGPDQAWLRYQRDGVSTEACAVLIGHMVENINRVVNRFRPFYYPETGIPLAKPRFVVQDGQPVLLPSPSADPEYLKDPLWVERELGPGDAWYVPGTFVAHPLDRLEVVSLARTARYRQGRNAGVEWTASWAEHVHQPGSEALAVLTAVLAGFADDVRDRGATPVVVIFPSSSEIAAERDDLPKTHASLVAALAARSIPTVDLTEALGQQARRSSLGNIVVNHYRPLGNTVVARTLSRELPKLTAASCKRG